MFLRLETELKPPRMLVPWVRALGTVVGAETTMVLARDQAMKGWFSPKKMSDFLWTWTVRCHHVAHTFGALGRRCVKKRSNLWKRTYFYVACTHTHIHECVILIANLVWGSQISRNHLVDSDMKLFVKCSQFVHRFWCILHSLRLAVERRGAACADKLVVL